MAATAVPQAVHDQARPRAEFDRTALAVLMPIGPLAIAIVRGILPYYTTDSNTVMAAKVAAHQGTESVVEWLTFIALLTLIPGVIALGLAARRHAPRLGTTGLVVTFAAVCCLFWSNVAGADTVALGAARIGTAPGDTGALLTSIGAIPAIGLGSNIFVVGHILGLLLLGVALWRGRVGPRWSAALLAVSQVLHFVFAVLAPNHALDGCAWGLTTLSFCVVAVTVYLRPNPELHPVQS